jgi:hypothetical protein
MLAPAPAPAITREATEATTTPMWKQQQQQQIIILYRLYILMNTQTSVRASVPGGPKASKNPEFGLNAAAYTCVAST